MKFEIFQPATETIEYFTEERCYITEVCNSPISPNGSLAIARVPAGTTTQLHSLNGTNETYIVIEGEGEVEVARGGSMHQGCPADPVLNIGVRTMTDQRLAALNILSVLRCRD